MTGRESQPVRPESEYGEHPAGAGGRPARGDAETSSGAPRSTGAEAPTRSTSIATPFSESWLAGEDMSKAQIARDTELETGQVGSLLSRLQHDGLVERTASGSWRLSPGAATTTTPTPSPKEPRQAD